MVSLKSNVIDPALSVQEIVTRDYRAAQVFRNHGIDYCCTGKWTLASAALMKGIPVEQLMEELSEAMQRELPYETWDICFLADYIVYVHHYYLKKALPEIRELLQEFVRDHREKYPELTDVEKIFLQMNKDIMPHMLEEEEVIFPYIRQISHAYERRESYAGLLVRTLRKPVEHLMLQEHRIIEKLLKRLRELTQNYAPPENACIAHRIAYARLRELDTDLVRHIYLEQEILFPRCLEMEKELLSSGTDA